MNPTQTLTLLWDIPSALSKAIDKRDASTVGMNFDAPPETVAPKTAVKTVHKPFKVMVRHYGEQPAEVSSHANRADAFRHMRQNLLIHEGYGHSIYRTPEGEAHVIDPVTKNSASIFWIKHEKPKKVEKSILLIDDRASVLEWLEKAEPGYGPPYGDPKRKKWPLNTEAHIHAALSYYGAGRGRKNMTAEEWTALGHRIAAAASRQYGVKHTLTGDRIESGEEAEKSVEEPVVDVLRRAAERIKHCGDYGVLYWNPRTKTAFWNMGDADGGDGLSTSEEIKHILGSVPGVRRVELGDESGPLSDKDGWAEIKYDRHAQIEKAHDGYSFSSTHFLLPDAASDALRKFAAKIPESELSEDGREKHHHVTLKYGLASQDGRKAVAALADKSPVTARFGPLAIFPASEGRDYDVLHVPVESAGLHALHAHICSKMPHTDTFAEYKPHVTVAYLKAGEGAKYVGEHPLEGIAAHLKHLEFSSRDKKVTPIKLEGEPMEKGMDDADSSCPSCGASGSPDNGSCPSCGASWGEGEEGGGANAEKAVQAVFKALASRYSGNLSLNFDEPTHTPRASRAHFPPLRASGASGLASASDEHWITVNGHHILIDRHGQPVGGGTFEEAVTGRQVRKPARAGETNLTPRSAGSLSAKEQEGKHLASAQERKAAGVAPGYSHVHVPDYPAHKMAWTGVDVKGRSKRVYKAAAETETTAAKFTRVKALTRALDSILRKNDRNLTAGAYQEEAAVIRLIHATAFRPGGETDTQADVKSFGATTLLKSHVSVEGDTIHFQFTGKSAHEQDKYLTDPTLAKIIKTKLSEPGERLFNTTDSKLRDYFHGLHSGGFHPKDLRTWGGTDLAIKTIAQMPVPANAKERKAAMKHVAQVVSQHLGNTPSVAMARYIDPTVFKVWEE